MKFFGKAHDATISQNLAKVSRKRMISRVQSIANSLRQDKKVKKGMSKAKRAKLTAELRGIMAELDAREETVNEILDVINDG